MRFFEKIGGGLLFWATLYKLYTVQDSKAQEVALTTALDSTIIKWVHLHLIYYNTHILNIYANKKKKNKMEVIHFFSLC